MGAVLNSKSEFNRCYIPRLRVVEDDEASDMEKSENMQAKEIEEEIRINLEAWEEGKRNIRKSKTIRKSVSVKNPGQDGPDMEGRAPKRMRFPLIKGWGEERQKSTSMNAVGVPGTVQGEEYAEESSLN